MVKRKKLVATLALSMLSGLVALQAPPSPATAVNGAGWSAVGGGLVGLAGSRTFQLVRASDGTLFAGGTFAGGVAKLAPTAGSTWQVLSETGYPSSRVYSLGLDEAANPPRLYAGGSFSNGLRWMNVTTGAWTDIGDASLSTDDGVEKLAIKSTTQAYVGGSFDEGPAAQADHGLTMHNNTGFASLAGGISTGGPADHQVTGLTLAGDLLYVGGRFSAVGTGAPITVRGLAVYSTTTSAWWSIGASDYGPTVESQSVIASIAVQNSNSIFVGGMFPAMQNGDGQTVTNTKGIAKWNGTAWVSIGAFTGTVVEELRIIGQYLYAGGSFTSIGGVTANNIARMNLTTGAWEPIVQACFNGVNGVVRTILDAGGTDEAIYVAGGFTDAAGIADADRVAKFTFGASDFCPTTTELVEVPSFDGPPNFKVTYYGILDTKPNYNNGQQGKLIGFSWGKSSKVDYYIYKVSAVEVMDWNSTPIKTRPLDSSYDCWSIGLSCEIVISNDDKYYSAGTLAFEVRGLTRDGVGKASFGTLPSPYDPVYPADAPTNATAVAGWKTVTVTWKAPTYTGTYPITYYLVTASPSGRSCLSKFTDAIFTQCVYSNLTPGTKYTFTVQALNGAGWSEESTASNAVAPYELKITKTSRNKARVLFVNVGSDLTVDGIAPGFAPGTVVTALVMWNNSGNWEKLRDIKVDKSGKLLLKQRFPRNRNSQTLSVRFSIGNQVSDSVILQPVP